MTPILMEEEYWRNSQLSIARFYGKIQFNGQMYFVVNKEGKDLIRCRIEAEKEGRAMVIEPGEPADLIDMRYLPLYSEIGRDRFIEVLKQHRYEELTPETLKKYAYDTTRTT